jgi:hypothetical protein
MKLQHCTVSTEELPKCDSIEIVTDHGVINIYAYEGRVTAYLYPNKDKVAKGDVNRKGAVVTMNQADHGIFD